MMSAILVLGAKCEQESSGEWVPAPGYRARLNAALGLASAQNVWTLIIAGRGKAAEDRGGLTEAAIGAKYVSDRGFSNNGFVLQEFYSNETIANFVYATVAFLDPLLVHRVTVVTSPRHCNRCHYIARWIWQHPERRKIEYDIFHAEGLENESTEEVKDYLTIDFVRDFVSDNKRATLDQAITYLKKEYLDAAAVEGYKTVSEAVRELQAHVEHDRLQELMNSSDQSLFGLWRDAFETHSDVRRRLYLYCATAPDGHSTHPDAASYSTDDFIRFRKALENIATLGLLTKIGQLDPHLAGMNVHRVPLKLSRAIRLDKTKLTDEQRNEFLYAKVLGLRFLLSIKTPQVVLRAGKKHGHSHEKTWKIPDMEKELMEAQEELGDWIKS